jgi:hypothetical protein
MIFAYLLVQGCNGCTYNGIPQLEKSINSLRAYLPDSKIYVYYGYDETSKDKVPDIETFISSKNLIGVNIGHLKHNFPIIGMKYVAETINNPYRFNILIEKIYVLLNHDEKEEVMYVDVDTIFKPQIRNFRVTNDNAILYDKGSKLLIQRNLDNFFKQLNYPVRSDSCMYNTGFIYVPANKRKAIAQEALDLVLSMNTISDTQRFAKDLDEQISLSIIIQKHYYNKINVMTNFMQNNMGQHIKKK